MAPKTTFNLYRNNDGSFSFFLAWFSAIASLLQLLLLLQLLHVPKTLDPTLSTPLNTSLFRIANTLAQDLITGLVSNTRCFAGTIYSWCNRKEISKNITFVVEITLFYTKRNGNSFYSLTLGRQSYLLQQLNSRARGSFGPPLPLPHRFSKWFHIKDQALACMQLWVS